MVTFINRVLKNYDMAAEEIVNKILEYENLSQHSELKDKAELSSKLFDFKDSFLRGYEYVLEFGPKYLHFPKKKFLLKSFHHEGTNTLQEACDYDGAMMKGIYRMGLDLYRAGDYQMCIDLYTFLIGLNPYICWFWQMVGKTYQAKKEFPDALNAYKVAINCNPFNFEGYNDAVNCCIQTKEFSGAIEIIDKGIDFINHSENAHQYNELIRNMELLKSRL